MVSGSGIREDVVTPEAVVYDVVALSTDAIGVIPTLTPASFVLEPALIRPALIPAVAPTVGDVGVVVGDVPAPAADDEAAAVGDVTLPAVPTTVAGEVDVATVSGWAGVVDESVCVADASTTVFSTPRAKPRVPLS